MSTDQRRRDLSYFVLCAGLVIAFLLFGVRANYRPGVYYAIADVQPEAQPDHASSAVRTMPRTARQAAPLTTAR